MTFNQLSKNKQIRIPQRRKSRAPLLKGKPQHRGVVKKIFILTPKKPNSAKRKVAKVYIWKKSLRYDRTRYAIAYIPGTGHNLHDNSVVLLRGGGVPDLIGVNYHLIRGKMDFSEAELFERKKSRSKYGIMNFNRKCL